MLNSKNKVIIFTVLFLIVFVSAFFVLKNKPATNNTDDNQNTSVNINNDQTVLYYSVTCPHCKIVEAYINDNNFTLKSQIVNKEVSQNEANAAELYAKAKICGIPSDQIGVPLLWYKGQCHVGDQPIINLFKTTNVQ
jgi:glutaredoxin